MNNNQFIAFYPSQDLEATRAFYQDTLGLALVRDQGVCLIFKVNEGGYVGFCTHLKEMPSSSFIITLVRDDVDGIYQQLKQQGVKLQEAPKLNEKYQIYHFFAQDPNGYKVEVQRFLEPLI